MAGIRTCESHKSNVLTITPPSHRGRLADLAASLHVCLLPSADEVHMQQIPATVSHYQFTAVCCLRTMYDVHLCLIKKPVVNFIVMLIELFTALHAMQTRSSDENYVGPSVCQTCAL